MKRLCALAMVWLAAATALAEEPAKEPAPPGQDYQAPEFQRDIAPIFELYCVGCHGADAPESGLVLESFELLLEGGEGGAAIVAGKSDQSRLLLMLTGKAEPAMPPEGNEAPTAEEIALIKAWIEAGAKGPDGEGPDPTRLVTPTVELKAPARQVINAAAISPDGKHAALAGYGEVRLMALDSRSTVRTFAPHRGNVTDVVFSNDGTRLLTAAGEPGLFGEARLWNVADGSLLLTLVGHGDSLYAAALSPDATLIATAGYDQKIKLWDVAGGQEQRTLDGHNGAVYDLAFSPNGKFLASASSDRTVKLWDVATGERLDTFGQPLKELYAVAFSPDGQRVAAGGVDNRIRVWQIGPSGREGENSLLYTRFAHEGAIIELAFSPDGATLVSSAEDRTVRVWEAASVEERRLLELQSDWPTALAIGPDNKTLLVGRLDGTLAIYDATSGQPMPPARPELAAAEPRGIQRGQASSVKLKGKFLLGASEVKSNHAGLAAAVKPGEQTTAEELLVEVTPAADLARGQYKLSVTTPGGTSGELTLYVDELPQLSEAGPNDGLDEAPLLTLPTGYWGLLDKPGDLDHVRFEARAGQTIVCELAAGKLGSSANGVLTLLGPTGAVVAKNNDFDSRDDALLAYQVPADGQYTVRVKDLAHGGSEKHFYRLSVGELAYVTGCYPLSVPANQETEVELAGYNLPPGAKVVLPASAPGEHRVPLDANRFRSSRELTVLASEVAEQLEGEPNDLPAEATSISISGSIGGRLWATREGQQADADLFRFEARAGQSLVLEVEAQRRGSPVDSKIEVLDVEGRPVERLLLQAVRDSYIDFRGVDSDGAGLRPKNWEEMELNEYMYLQGEVCKIFRMPQGPDSDTLFYTLGGKRRCYFDTSPTAHAFEETLYIVEPHPAGTALVPNGLPVFPVYYANDDDMERKLGRDSRLTFTAPADGSYLVRVSDVRGFGGDRFAYRLIVREPRPDFQVTLADVNATVHAASGRRLTFSANRIDGFDGDIVIDAGELPPGFSLSTPLVIEAGHVEARAVLTAEADASQPTAEQWAQVKLTARADIGGSQVVKDVNGLGNVKLAEKPNLLVRVEPAEVVIAPGTTVTAMLKIERNGFDDLLNFDVDNLPHGVIVDNIGLNGVLIPAGQTERQIFLTAAKWVPDTDRKFHAVASSAGAQASPPVVLHVRKPDTVAQASDGGQ
ncbi:MAG: c-type cytochrome domain-containing protein [Pirellulales bacterium]